mmetsp:Transcript_5500/g.17336  ORF Transcript_5500/g.17336 Transcript_5500/m.17336 type:complete len:116 (+) Transcript_5500:109-456(+)
MLEQQVERFLKGSMEVKLEVLRGLRENDIADFERDVHIAQGTADDMALILSFKDLAGEDSGLKRSGSEIYWHRCTGDQDFECSPTERPKSGEVVPKDDEKNPSYWDQLGANGDDC